MIYTFTLEGPIKPYVRMTRRGKYTDPDAQQYLASQSALALQYRNQMALNNWTMIDSQFPLEVNVQLTKTFGLHRSDSDNILKAILDAAQGIVFQNDMWVDAVCFRRSIGLFNRAIVTVEVMDAED